MRRIGRYTDRLKGRGQEHPASRRASGTARNVRRVSRNEFGLHSAIAGADDSGVIHDVVGNQSAHYAMRQRIGDLFVDQGIIDDQQLAEALDVQRRTGGRLGEILIELGFVTSLDSARVLAERLGLEFIDLNSLPVDEILAQRIPEEIGIAR